MIVKIILNAVLIVTILQKSQWILIFDDEICEIEFGRIVMSWLNQINPLKPDNNNVVENLITEITCKASPDEVNRRSKLWKDHYDSIVDFIMKKHIKSQDELMSFYKIQVFSALLF